jgi:hypothetical protein
MQLKLKPRRREFRAKETTRVNVYVSRAQLKIIEQLQKEVYQFSRQKITMAYLFREGAGLLMRKIRREMKKAQKGIFHAKPRKDFFGK